VRVIFPVHLAQEVSRRSRRFQVFLMAALWQGSGREVGTPAPPEPLVRRALQCLCSGLAQRRPVSGRDGNGTVLTARA
jgi:hypothetical protein